MINLWPNVLVTKCHKRKINSKKRKKTFVIEFYDWMICYLLYGHKSVKNNKRVEQKLWPNIIWSNLWPNNFQSQISIIKNMYFFFFVISSDKDMSISSCFRFIKGCILDYGDLVGVGVSQNTSSLLEQDLLILKLIGRKSNIHE